MFSHLVVHRTSVTAAMTRERQSAEFRVFPAGRIPDYVTRSAGWSFELP
jgi:hypothetical protein